MNTGKNRFGRLVALLLLIAALYGVRSIAQCGSMCPFGGSFRCAASPR